MPSANLEKKMPTHPVKPQELANGVYQRKCCFLEKKNTVLAQLDVICISRGGAILECNLVGKSAPFPHSWEHIVLESTFK